MASKRTQYSNQFKFNVALDAVKKLQTINGIASKHNVHVSALFYLMTTLFCGATTGVNALKNAENPVRMMAKWARHKIH